MAQITITDVASAAGVGVGTVSRVINNGQSVRPTTAAKVRQAMAELGYQPPPVGKRRGPRPGTSRRARTTQRSVMLLLCGGQDLKWILSCAPVYAYVVHGIEAALAGEHRNLVVRQTPTWTEVQAVIRQNRMDGAILMGREPQGTTPSQLEKIPAIWVMGRPERFRGDHVFPDHVRIGETAAGYLLRQGHLHCACLGQAEEWAPNAAGVRGASFRWIVEQAGGTVHMLVDSKVTVTGIDRNDVDEQVIGRLLDEMLAAEPRPTALMLQADMFAPAVYRRLLERGIQPQRDITIVTCNNERPYLAALHPSPVVVDLQAETIGRRAVSQLLWRRQHPEETAMRIMIEPTLVE